MTVDGWLRERLDRLLAGLRPRKVVGSAAAGADLLALRAALASGASAEVLVSEDVEDFRAASVHDKGDEWDALFRALVGRAGVTLHRLPGTGADDEGFRRINEALLTRAGEEVREDEEVLVVGITAGRRQELDHTEDLLAAAEAAGHLVLRIDPTTDRARTPTAFVAMAYGVRPAQFRDSRDWAADATWHRILVPALLDAGYRPVRADLEVSLEIIDAKMVRAIAYADLFIADLATLNPNVFWEIGVRHAWRRSGTLLIKPHGSPPPPFDVGHVPVVDYRRDPDMVNDRDSVRAVSQLRDALAAVAGKVDSPVFAALPGLRPVELPSAETSDGADTLTRVVERISLAADLRDAAGLMGVLRELPESLSGADRAALTEQVAFALSDLNRFDDALTLLTPLAEADTALDKVRLQQRYALALIHAQEPRSERLARTRHAELRLAALDRRHPGSGETLGLLGSAAKQAFLSSREDPSQAARYLASAIDAYRRGQFADPTDYFPGVNAVALLRIRAQHFADDAHPRNDDLEEAQLLVQVTRFAVIRPQAADSAWRRATLGELCLHEFLLDPNRGSLPECRAQYAAAATVATVGEVESMRRQLSMFRELGDPADVIDSILAVLPLP